MREHGRNLFSGGYGLGNNTTVPTAGLGSKGVDPTFH